MKKFKWIEGNKIRGDWRLTFRHPNGSFFFVEVHNCDSEIECEERAKEAIMKSLEDGEYSLLRTEQISTYKEGSSPRGTSCFILHDVPSPIVTKEHSYEKIIEDLIGMEVAFREEHEVEGVIIAKGEPGVIIGGKIKNYKIELEVQIKGIKVLGEPYKWKWLNLYRSEKAKFKKISCEMRDMNDSRSERLQASE